MRRMIVVLFILILISASTLSALAQEGGRAPITASNAGQVALLHEYETMSRSYKVFFSPDGQRLATLNEDNSIWVWDVSSGEEVSILQSPEPLWDGVFSPHGDLLVTLTSQSTDVWNVQLWDVASGEQLSTFEDVIVFAFSPDGTSLAIVTERSVTLWEVGSGDEASTAWKLAMAHIFEVAFSPDSSLVAIAGQDRDLVYTVWLWEVATGRMLKTLHGHTDLVLSLAFSPDSSLLASGDADQTVRLWDVASGEELPFAQKYPFDVYQVAFSPDGNILAATGTSHADTQLWDVASGQQIHDFHGYQTYGFGPDATVMLVGDIDTITLWDMATYTPLLELFGADIPVFSPDGSLIASGNAGGEVRIWGIPLEGEQPLE